MCGFFSRSVYLLLIVCVAAVFAGCSGGDSDRLPTQPGLELSLTAGSPPNQDVAADVTAVISHIHLDAPGAQDVSISSITLSATGSGDDQVDISSVEIYLDANDSDTYNPGVDVLIGTGGFDSDNGEAQIVFSGPQIVSPGAGRNWLVLYTLSGCGPNGATYSFIIESTDDVDVTYISGHPTYADGLPLASAALTITSGGAKLNLLVGPNPPADREVLNATVNLPVFQFTLYNRDSGVVTVTSLRLTPTGSGDDAAGIWQAHVRIDSNGDGRYNAGEPLFADYTYATDDTWQAVPGSYAIPAGTKAHFLVLYDFDASAATGSDFRANIAATNHITAEDAGASPVAATGTAPVRGAVITIVEKGTLAAQAGSHNPPDGGALAGATNMPVLQLELQVGAIEDVIINSLTVHATGTTDDSTDITRVRVYKDADGDGGVGAGDTELASGQYSVDDGGLIFGSVGLVIVAGQTANLLITYDVAATAQSGSTFGTYIANAVEIGATGAVSSLGIPATGTFPISGGIFELRTPDSFGAAADLNTGRFMHTQTTFTDPADGKARVLVCGGYDGSSTLDTAEVYDPELDTWTVLPSPMTKVRMLHTATVLADGQRIVIAGGTDGVATTWQDGEMFDPATYSFTAIADNMSARRQMHTAVLIDSGDVFYFGGQYIFGDLKYVETTEYYNQPVNRFDPVGTSQYVRILHTMNKLSGGTVMVSGGLGYARSGPKGTTLLKSVQLWATSPTIYESISWLALAGFGRCGHVAVSMPGGQLLIAGGYTLNLYIYTYPPFLGRKTAELIKENNSYLGDETIEDVGEMSAVRFMPVAQLLPDGKVLIAAGTDDSTNADALDTAELYDPAAQTFSDSAGTMVQARYRTTWSMIPGPDGLLGTADDMVLIVGGLTEYAPSPAPSLVTRSAEIYVP